MSDTKTTRTHKVGPHTLETVQAQTTTLGRRPLYAVCTPDRWGLRYSDEDRDKKGELVYPVARDFAKKIQDVLVNQVRWGKSYFGPVETNPALELQWPISLEDQKRLSDLYRPIVIEALTTPAAGFGIPAEAVPAKMGLHTPRPGSAPGEQGAFSPNDWSLLMSISTLEPLFAIQKVESASKIAERNDQLQPLRDLSDTIFHEARHCQQWSWIYAMILQYPDNFEGTPNIKAWPAEVSGASGSGEGMPGQSNTIIALAKKQTLPTDTAALLSIKRMAIGQYVYVLNVWRKVKQVPSYLSDLAALDAEFLQARAAAIELLKNVGIGGKSIDVDAMVAESSTCFSGYTSRPWENDAFFCGDMATAYWKSGLGLAFDGHETDQCSYAYEHAEHNDSIVLLMDRLRRGANGSSGAH